MADLPHTPDDRRTGFTMPLDDVMPATGSSGVSLTPFSMNPARDYQCIACGKPAKPDQPYLHRTAVFKGHITSDVNWVHVDGSPLCQDWVGPLIREVEKRLREFDREGRERGLPGPLQRDPSEPIVVEVNWWQPTGKTTDQTDPTKEYCDLECFNDDGDKHP